MQCCSKQTQSCIHIERIMVIVSNWIELKVQLTMLAQRQCDGANDFQWASVLLLAYVYIHMWRCMAVITHIRTIDNLLQLNWIQIIRSNECVIEIFNLCSLFGKFNSTNMCMYIRIHMFVCIYVFMPW